MDRAVSTAEQNRLTGADAVVAALAEELGMTGMKLKTFDREILARFLPASA